MSWNKVVLTDLGERLLFNMFNGSKLTFTAAAIGSGIVEEDELPGLSNVTSPINAPALIAGQRKPASGNGTEILLQIRNDGVEEAVKMRQVGLFAKTESSEEIFFAVLQDENGEEIPAYKDFSQFEISFSVAIALSRTNNITIVVSPLVYVTKVDLEKHNTDENAHSTAFNTKIDKDDVSNPNLLINSWFGKGVINQRGLTEYSNSSNAYTFAVDRWAFKKGGDTSATITVSDNGVTISPSTAIVHIMDSELIDSITGKTLTLSVNIDDVIISGTFTWTDQAYFVIKETDSLRVAYSATGKYIQIFNTSTTESKNVKWAKLEIGSVATQFVAPDPLTEKVKCGIPDNTSEYGYRAIVNADSVSGKTVAVDVPANAKFTDTTYGNASATAAGLVSTGTQTFAGNKTFNGIIDCNGAGTVTTAQARNIYAGTSDMTAGTSTLESGAIYLVYE